MNRDDVKEHIYPVLIGLLLLSVWTV